jgi:hypothetical protein
LLLWDPCPEHFSSNPDDYLSDLSNDLCDEQWDSFIPGVV